MNEAIELGQKPRNGPRLPPTPPDASPPRNYVSPAYNDDNELPETELRLAPFL